MKESEKRGADGAVCLAKRLVNDISAAAEKYDVKKVILFGSRARGSNRERSDIDLAVQGGDADSFFLELQENAHTLLSFDVVDLDQTGSDELKKVISREGVVLYEKA